MQYIRRLIDEQLDEKEQVFKAINIIGPKGCGKTRTAKERCKTIIEFQDEDVRDRYLTIANTSPSTLLKNTKPILFDEWQDAPKIWGTIRKDCDDNFGLGEYYLTGSTSKDVKTSHTGTGRISTITMYPMSLYESGDSSGEISLHRLIEDDDYIIPAINDKHTIEDYFSIVCRGGWPKSLEYKNEKSKLGIAKDYYHQIYTKDIRNFDNTRRNPELSRTILWSYARNIATTATKKSIYDDIKANYDVSEDTIDKYVEVLQQLFVLKDIDAWAPQIRSKKAIRKAKKHIFIDPSIACAALNIEPNYFINDFDTFGHIFENLVLRDLIIYAEMHGARIMHYRDENGLEADGVYQLPNGEYALIEIKLSFNNFDRAKKNFLKFKELIKKHNKEALSDKEHPGVLYKEPKRMIFISASGGMPVVLDEGIVAIPFGCLKD